MKEAALKRRLRGVSRTATQAESAGAESIGKRNRACLVSCLIGVWTRHLLCLEDHENTTLKSGQECNQYGVLIVWSQPPKGSCPDKMRISNFELILRLFSSCPILPSYSAPGRQTLEQQTHGYSGSD